MTVFSKSLREYANDRVQEVGDVLLYWPGEQEERGKKLSCCFVSRASHFADAANQAGTLGPPHDARQYQHTLVITM